MKQEILEALTTKFEGVDEKILLRLAERLSKTVASQDDVATAVAGVTFRQVLEAYGDSRATEAAKTSVANYEKKYGLKNGEKVKEEYNSDSSDTASASHSTNITDNGTDVSKLIANAIATAIQPLQERVASIEAAKINDTRRKRYGKVLGKLPEGLRKGYERIPLDTLTEEDFEQLLSTTDTEVDALNKDLGGKSTVFGKPLGNGTLSTAGGEATTKEVDDVVSHLNI